jgi:hypothetical protein
MYLTFNRRRRALLASIDGKCKFVLLTQLRETENVETMTKEDCSKLFLQAMGCDTPPWSDGLRGLARRSRAGS